MFSIRLKQAREAANLTIEALAEVLGVPVYTIEKYEYGETMPSSTNLHKLAQALEVSSEYLLRPVRATPESLIYPKASDIHAKLLSQINIDVLEQADRWLELLELYPESVSPLPRFELPGNLPDSIKTHEEVEAIATTIRNQWELGQDAIPDMINTLETKGILIIATTRVHNKNFYGLGGSVNALPFIVFSLHQPGDRLRFKLAHELARLVLHGRLYGLDEETACSHFAGAFLLTQQAVVQHIGSKRHAIEPRELYLLKHKFGISMMLILERMEQSGIISRSIQESYIDQFNQQAWQTEEPGQPYPIEEAILYKQLVYRAMGEGYIGELKAAELLGITLASFHKERTLGQEALNIGQGFLWKTD